MASNFAENGSKCQSVECHQRINLRFFDQVQETLCVDCAFARGLLSTKVITLHREKCLQHAEGAFQHLKKLEDEVSLFFDERLARESRRAERETAAINDEAEEKIKLIREEQEHKLNQVSLDSAQRVLPLQTQREKVIRNIKAIDDTVSSRIEKLSNSSRILYRVLIDESLDERAEPKGKTSDPDSKEKALENIVQDHRHLSERVHRLSFVKDIGEDGLHGRIEGGMWQWLLDVIISKNTQQMRMVGLLSDDEVISRHEDRLYVTGLATGETRRLVPRGQSFASCVPLTGNRLACGKILRRSLGRRMSPNVTIYDDAIEIYDDQQECVKGIPLSARPLECDRHVHLDVDRDGKILACMNNESNIYVIDSDKGKVERTLSLVDKKIHFMDGRVQSLPCGGVLATTNYDFTIIDKTGVIQSVIPHGERHFPQCTVDPLTSTLFMVYAVPEQGVHTIDRLSCDGAILAERIVSYPLSTTFLLRMCLITKTGKLITCNGTHINMYGQQIDL